MARHEEDREDLLAEATALIERASIRLPQQTDELVLGFRRNGSFSVYFSPDRIYQFTSDAKLRRAFLDGLLYKADRGTLVAMRRERGADVVSLTSRALDAAETEVFLTEMLDHVRGLHEALAEQSYVLIGQVPSDGATLERAAQWLATYAGAIAIAQSPRSS